MLDEIAGVIDSVAARKICGMERSASPGAEQILDAWHLAELAQHDGVLEVACYGIASARERHRAGLLLGHAARRALRRAGRLPVLRLAGNEFAFLGADEGHRRE